MSTVGFSHGSTITAKSWIAEVWVRINSLFGNNGSSDIKAMSSCTDDKWESEIKDIQNEIQMLCNQAVYNLIPMAGAYQQHLMDILLQASTVYAPEDAEVVFNKETQTIENIKGHVSGIQYNTDKMCEANRKVNELQDAQAKAVVYHHSVKPYMNTLRFHVDELKSILHES